MVVSKSTQSLTLVSLAGPGVKIGLYLRGGISTQGHNSSSSVAHVPLSYSIILNLE